jgi:hypothetical protein
MSAEVSDDLISLVRAMVNLGITAVFACNQVGLKYETWIYHTTRKGKSHKRKREEPPQQPPHNTNTEAA